MSGIIKSIGKVFKKVVKKVKESKILKAVVIAAAAYYAFSAAQQYFAVPPPDSALTIANSTNTFTTTAETMGAETVGTISTPTAAVGAPIPAAAPVAETALAPGVTGTMEADAYSASLGMEPGVSPGGIVKGAVEKGGGAMDWMAKNPLATMMIGQGVTGAVGSYEQRKAQEEQRAADRERGLMGVDYQGRQQGIVAPQMAPRQATAGAQQQAVRPIERKNLPQLRKQNLVRRV